ncbi:hypothetical protein SKAU_G00134080 [Synaphobranchus kaupii]|uniref:Reverse transcriptase domain-containing protein n=1 Tax=Synaphobranchus kaupii TaxID=118154 RepID=A0A9Q1J1H8_SYNKA|nr:hypothetical protein SKAU_G00134080 [Synaphobranchus kaupii]
MYDGIRKALGPVQSKTAPLKSTTGEAITDKGQQMVRWVEHYSELYSRENTVSPLALDAIECLPTMVELDAELTTAELSKAIDSLAAGKVPGSDGIPPDLIKHCKTALLPPLHKVLHQCWQEGAVPQDMRDAKIITLYKNKGERRVAFIDVAFIDLTKAFDLVSRDGLFNILRKIGCPTKPQSLIESFLTNMKG